jgi:hypothetical protein
VGVNRMLLKVVSPVVRRRAATTKDTILTVKSVVGVPTDIVPQPANNEDIHEKYQE